jgi:hypothetical protein
MAKNKYCQEHNFKFTTKKKKVQDQIIFFFFFFVLLFSLPTYEFLFNLKIFFFFFFIIIYLIFHLVPEFDVVFFKCLKKVFLKTLKKKKVKTNFL